MMTHLPQNKGTAYEMKPSTYIASLTEVGRGTPMGELLRRYWHPVGLSTHATNVPREVRALGEDLVLFRDGKGRPAWFIPAAVTAAPRSTTARWKRTAFAVAIMAGNST